MDKKTCDFGNFTPGVTQLIGVSQEDTDENRLLALVLNARAAIKKEANGAAALPSLRQLGPGLVLRQQRTQEHQRLADSVAVIDDAQAVGVAVGDENAEGERGQCQTEAFALVLRFAGTDDGNAAGATSSGL